MTTPTPAPSANEAVFRTSLRDMLVLLGVLTVLGVVIGFLVDGMAGVWGALLGVGIALIFSGTTVISGSYFITGGGPFTGAPRLSYSVDDQANGWTVGFANTVDGSGPFTFVAVAYCIS